MHFARVYSSAMVALIGFYCEHNVRSIREHTWTFDYVYDGCEDVRCVRSVGHFLSSVGDVSLLCRQFESFTSLLLTHTQRWQLGRIGRGGAHVFVCVLCVIWLRILLRSNDRPFVAPRWRDVGVKQPIDEIPSEMRAEPPKQCSWRVASLRVRHIIDATYCITRMSSKEALFECLCLTLARTFSIHISTVAFVSQT